MTLLKVKAKIIILSVNKYFTMQLITEELYRKLVKGSKIHN